MTAAADGSFRGGSCCGWQGTAKKYLCEARLGAGSGAAGKPARGTFGNLFPHWGSMKMIRGVQSWGVAA